MRPTLADLRAERCRRSLGEFTREAWPLLEPATRYVPGWHIDTIAERLEAAARGELRRLIINVPPRHMKSLLVAVLWPAWTWLTSPERRFLYASYAEPPAINHSIICRRLVESRGRQVPAGGEATLLERVGYRGLLRLLHGADAWRLTGDQNLKRRFENTRSGFRLTTSVGGSVLGEGGDVCVLDDPHKPEEVESDAQREAVLRWHDSTWSTRLNDAETGVRIVVMQRLHERDLTGHLLERGGYEHVCLPAQYEPGHPYGWRREPRSEAGEVLLAREVGWAVAV